MGDDKYKSKFSSICSIIIIALLTAFTIYSIVEYFKYESPSIVYFTDNDDESNRTASVQDSIMFSVYDYLSDSFLTEGQVNFDAVYVETIGQDTYYRWLEVEKCELGKNIKQEYKDKLSDINLEDYLCFAENLTKYPLYYMPNVERSSILLNFTLDDAYNNTNSDNLYFFFISGNDVIDHRDSNSPFNNMYYTTTISEIINNKYNIFRYFFQYIKYESDRGFIFDSSHTYTAKTFSHSDVLRGNIDESYTSDYSLGIVTIQISHSNFDNYVRTYPKIQTL